MKKAAMTSHTVGSPKPAESLLDRESAEQRGEGDGAEHQRAAGDRLENQAADRGQENAEQAPAFRLDGSRAWDNVDDGDKDQDEDERTDRAAAERGCAMVRGVIRRGLGSTDVGFQKKVFLYEPAMISMRGGFRARAPRENPPCGSPGTRATRRTGRRCAVPAGP